MLTKALAVEAEDVMIQHVWLPAGKGGFKHQCSAWKYTPVPLWGREGTGQEDKGRE